jgi:hypothetical protein
MMRPESGCVVAEWAKPEGCYLTASLQSLATGAWKEMTLSFTPQDDGVVTLKLMGAAHRVPGSDDFIPVWVYNDDVRVEGAEIANGSFEGEGKQGVPDGWRVNMRPGLWIRDPDLAAAGECCVKTSHNHRFAQQLTLTKGHKVTIRLKVRGVGD